MTPNSRSYLNHFTQPDSIVPNPNNPQAWDRYAYVGNNPVRYNDPSGHRPCEDGNCQINPLAYRITYGFGWILKGKNWTGKELQTIFVTGNRIKNYIDNLTNGKGQQWMDKYLSNTAFRKWDEKNNQAWPAWMLGENTISITKNSFTPRWITHELAHIWDINTSRAVGLFGAHGGVGDDLNTFVGGYIADSVLNCRYCNGSGEYTIPEDAQYTSGYGNNSTADYLAETFTFQIYPAENPGGDIGTKSASSWVQAFIINEASALP